MPLLNYTTSVDVDKSLWEIERRLRAHGVREVSRRYDDRGRPCALVFALATAVGEQRFALPARIDAVYATLEAQRRKGKVPPRYANREQAARVAWRILKDWLEAQLAILESGAVTLDEVMMPWMLDGRGRTAYEVMREQLALPRPEERG